MDIERLAGVVLDAFSVTFKFICNVDSFHDLAQKGVIYRKENKDTTLKVKNICKSYLLKIPFLQCKFVEVVTKNARFTKFLKRKKVSSFKFEGSVVFFFSLQIKRLLQRSFTSK